jgi:flagellar biosynthesis activator protein FlaF
MTTTTQGQHTAYTSQQKSIENSRDIDARALLSCAQRMQATLDAGAKDVHAYADAVRHNQRLWTIFQVAICDPDNPLPKDLKMTLLNLSRYIDRTSFRVINEFSPSLLKSLIDINRTIAAGLSRKPKGTETQMPAPPPGGHAPVMTSI